MSVVRKIGSPCRGKCDVDKKTELCYGCFRKIQEIKEWRKYDQEQRRMLIEITYERRVDWLKAMHGDPRSNLNRTPCKGNCSLDSTTFLCNGCYLYPEEIKKWHDLSLQDRETLVDQMRERQIQHRKKVTG